MNCKEPNKDNTLLPREKPPGTREGVPDNVSNIGKSENTRNTTKMKRRTFLIFCVFNRRHFPICSMFNLKDEFRLVTI